MLAPLVACFSIIGAAQPADETKGVSHDAATLFIEVVQPTVKQQCVGCHGEGNTFSELDLRTRESMLKGGKRGPALMPGRATDSLLFQVLDGHPDLQMPPGDGKQLPAETVLAVRRWIDGGAPFAEGDARQQWDYAERDLWAFRALSDLKPSGIELDAERIQTPVDRFINDELINLGLTVAPRADRRTLIRRVTFDLHGLPPTPEETQVFLEDTSPTAYKTLIEQLLASPRYGERWGRHWLDVTRYADTNGFSNDFERPNAWRYRDYVIRAFNQDKPYEQFIREQIAGDELYPDNPEALIATGFLRAGPWEHTGMSVAAVDRQFFLDDVTHHTGSTFLSLTLGCARCHDHKFDPLPTEDYYKFQAAFATTQFARRPVAWLDAEKTSGFDDGLAALDRRLERLQEKIKEFETKIETAAMKRHGVSRPEDLPEGVLKAALRSHEDLTQEEFEALKLYRKHSSLLGEMRDRYRPMAFSVSSGYFDGEADTGPADRAAMLALDEKPETHILVGGNLQSPAKKVQPGVLQAVERYSGFPTPNVPDTITGRRAALANWIAHPDNPLTARVMVNRIWQYHFGQGLAANANNFGKMGQKPVYPKLLDWLARYFVDTGWSVKAIHRVILLSAAYRRSSDHPEMELLRERDPENKYLTHFSPRRLEAEEIRDSALYVAGELSPQRGGPGTYSEINADVAKQPQHRMGTLAPPYQPSPSRIERNRRTVYTFQQRSLIDPLVEPFDPAGMDMSCERRDASIVPTQAFTLMNSRFSHDTALAFATRLEHEAEDDKSRVIRAFELAWNRAPSEDELDASLDHLRQMIEHHRRNPAPEPTAPETPVHRITSELTGETFEIEAILDPVDYEANLHPSQASPETRALADLALVLLNSNQFVYVY